MPRIQVLIAAGIFGLSKAPEQPATVYVRQVDSHLPRGQAFRVMLSDPARLARLKAELRSAYNHVNNDVRLFSVGGTSMLAPVESTSELDRELAATKSAWLGYTLGERAAAPKPMTAYVPPPRQTARTASVAKVADAAVQLQQLRSALAAAKTPFPAHRIKLQRSIAALLRTEKQSLFAVDGLAADLAHSAMFSLARANVPSGKESEALRNFVKNSKVWHAYEVAGDAQTQHLQKEKLRPIDFSTNPPAISQPINTKIYSAGEMSHFLATDPIEKLGFTHVAKPAKIGHCVVGPDGYCVKHGRYHGHGLLGETTHAAGDVVRGAAHTTGDVVHGTTDVLLSPFHANIGHCIVGPDGYCEYGHYHGHGLVGETVGAAGDVATGTVHAAGDVVSGTTHALFGADLCATCTARCCPDHCGPNAIPLRSVGNCLRCKGKHCKKHCAQHKKFKAEHAAQHKALAVADVDAQMSVRCGVCKREGRHSSKCEHCGAQMAVRCGMCKKEGHLRENCPHRLELDVDAPINCPLCTPTRKCSQHIGAQARISCDRCGKEGHGSGDHCFLCGLFHHPHPCKHGETTQKHTGASLLSSNCKDPFCVPASPCTTCKAVGAARPSFSPCNDKFCVPAAPCNNCRGQQSIASSITAAAASSPAKIGAHPPYHNNEAVLRFSNFLVKEHKKRNIDIIVDGELKKHLDYGHSGHFNVVGGKHRIEVRDADSGEVVVHGQDYPFRVMAAYMCVVGAHSHRMGLFPFNLNVPLLPLPHHHVGSGLSSSSAPAPRYAFVRSEIHVPDGAIWLQETMDGPRTAITGRDYVAVPVNAVRAHVAMAGGRQGMKREPLISPALEAEGKYLLAFTTAPDGAIVLNLHKEDIPFTQQTVAAPVARRGVNFGSLPK